MQFSADKKSREWEYLETFIVTTIMQGLQGMDYSLREISTLMISIECGVLQTLTQLTNVDKKGIEEYYKAKALIIDECKKEVIKIMED